MHGVGGQQIGYFVRIFDIFGFQRARRYGAGKALGGGASRGQFNDVASRVAQGRLDGMEAVEQQSAAFSRRRRAAAGGGGAV